MQTASHVARLEGVALCLEGGAAVAGLRHLVQIGEVRQGERVVVFNTASGLKGM
jgi:threonine synthase